MASPLEGTALSVPKPAVVNRHGGSDGQHFLHRRLSVFLNRSLRGRQSRRSAPKASECAAAPTRDRGKPGALPLPPVTGHDGPVPTLERARPVAVVVKLMRTVDGALGDERVLEFAISMSGAIAAISKHGATTSQRRCDDDEEKEGVGKFLHGAQWNRFAEA